MRSSSIAQVAGAATTVALVLSYSPIYLTPDALAQTIAQQTALPSSSPVLISGVSGTLSASVAATSSQPETVSANITANVVSATSSPSATYPRLIVPSIDLNDPIVEVGLTPLGAMAVPSGKTNEVGLFKDGPQPGEVGSAVLDAHVFAAFSKLNQLKAGDSIYVEMSATETLHFVVTRTKLFALSRITPQDLFVPTTDRDLNLITCAGKLIDNNTTYDHRFVVYATLMNS